jgi:hypothetical protein
MWDFVPQFVPHQGRPAPLSRSSAHDGARPAVLDLCISMLVGLTSVEPIMTSVSTPTASASFAEIWQRSSGELRSGRTRIDIEPPRKWPLYSFVCRIPHAVGKEAVDRLIATDPAWSAHYVYPPSTVHMTVLFLTPYLGIGAQTDPDELRRKLIDAEELARDVFAAFGPITFRAYGLNAFPSTVFLQLLPRDPAMPYKIRRALADRLLSAGFPGATPADYEGRKPLHLAYSNFVRFRHTLSPQLLPTIEANRETDFGEVTLGTVELVKSDKVLSEKKTETISQFVLS